MDESKLAQWYGDDFMATEIPEESQAKKDLLDTLPEMLTDECKCILCADSQLFKKIAKVKKSSELEGYPVETQYGVPVFVVPNYGSTYYNPDAAKKIEFIMSKVNDYLQGSYQELGNNIIKTAWYPEAIEDIIQTLEGLAEKPVLTVDIETKSLGNIFNLTKKQEEAFGSPLHHFTNEIYSIAFAWNKHEGTAFLVAPMQDYLREFFENYRGKLIFHNAGFDVTQLIYHLWMNKLDDYKGMLKGLHIMCRNLEDSMIVTYLATNTCGKAELGLKPLAHEYTGNYGVDVSDVTQLPVKELLEYNLKDVLATWYVYEKYYPIMVNENQEELYTSLFMPSLKVLIETQLVGFRIYPDRLEELNKNLTSYSEGILKQLNSYPWIKELEKQLNELAAKKYNAKTKKKKKTPDDFDEKFNPNSNNHISIVLYDILKLPVIDTTEKGNPATGTETLEKLVNHATDEYVKEFLKNLTEYSAAAKILSAFIPAFEHTQMVKGRKALYGSFKLGGTVSGRLSSSRPNLQNLPSTGSKYAKPVKRIFGYPKGYIFIGADQRSLEDRISALTTRDSNKLSVYTSGYDGHSLRAYTYFKEKMPDIKLAKPDEKCYKVTTDNGEIIYCTQEDLFDTIKRNS